MTCRLGEEHWTGRSAARVHSCAWDVPDGGAGAADDRVTSVAGWLRRSRAPVYQPPATASRTPSSGHAPSDAHRLGSGVLDADACDAEPPWSTPGDADAVAPTTVAHRTGRHAAADGPRRWRALRRRRAPGPREESFVVLDHDDLLDAAALLAAMAARRSTSTADVDYLYSDEDKVDDRRRRSTTAFRKPDWSPERLRGQHVHRRTCRCCAPSLVARGGRLPRRATTAPRTTTWCSRVTERARRRRARPARCSTTGARCRARPPATSTPSRTPAIAGAASRRRITSTALGIAGTVEQAAAAPGRYRRRGAGPRPVRPRLDRHPDHRVRPAVVWGAAAGDRRRGGPRRCSRTPSTRTLEVVVVYDTPTPPEVLDRAARAAVGRPAGARRRSTPAVQLQPRRCNLGRARTPPAIVLVVPQRRRRGRSPTRVARAARRHRLDEPDVGADRARSCYFSERPDPARRARSTRSGHYHAHAIRDAATRRRSGRSASSCGQPRGQRRDRRRASARSAARRSSRGRRLRRGAAGRTSTTSTALATRSAAPRLAHRLGGQTDEVVTSSTVGENRDGLGAPESGDLVVATAGPATSTGSRAAAVAAPDSMDADRLLDARRGGVARQPRPHRYALMRPPCPSAERWSVVPWVTTLTAVPNRLVHVAARHARSSPCSRGWSRCCRRCRSRSSTSAAS